MGSGFDETGAMAKCEGDDVLKALNDAFGDPLSVKYKYAKDNNTFGNIQNVPGNYKDLILAYLTAGVDVCARWSAYLRVLGTVRTPDPQQGPQNIYDIAQFRDSCLKNGLGMSTITHTPHDGGHVHTQPGSGINPAVVDSPFPLI